MICPHCSAGLISGWAPRPGETRLFSPIVIVAFPILLFMRWTFPRLQCEDCRKQIAVRELEPIYRRPARIKQIIATVLFVGFVGLILSPVFLVLMKHR